METKNPEVGESLGQRIARLRRGKGWSQSELGRRTGITASSISKYERGAYQPGADAVVRFSAALGVSSDYLLTGRFESPRQDYRLRDRLEALERLPDEQRDNLVMFLDGLLKGHRSLSPDLVPGAYSRPTPTTRTGSSRPRPMPERS